MSGQDELGRFLQLLLAAMQLCVQLGVRRPYSFPQVLQYVWGTTGGQAPLFAGSKVWGTTGGHAPLFAGSKVWGTTGGQAPLS